MTQRQKEKPQKAGVGAESCNTANIMEKYQKTFIWQKRLSKTNETNYIKEKNWAVKADNNPEGIILKP